MKKILIVDNDPNNLFLMKSILADKYHLIYAKSDKIAIKLANTHQPNLILLDIMMPDMNGYEVCETLKTNSQTKDIPVIFISAMSEIKDETYGFEVGAVDYIHKPISPPILLKRVENHINLVRANKLENSYQSAIEMLGHAGHYNDTDTGAHIWRMAAYAKKIAESIGWDETQARTLELAAPMHDTGKIGIPDSILKAPRKLDKKEWEVMKKHVILGFDILSHSDTPVFQMAAEIALYHHEKWDGSGYPMGVSGENIPISARIVAIADVFDALTMKRPYKNAWPVDKAVEEIKNGSGSHFDPELVYVFNSNIAEILKIKDYWDNHSEHNFDNSNYDKDLMVKIPLS